MTGVLIRTLRATNPYMVGDDVRAIRRACLKFNGEPASKLTVKQQQTYGPGMEQLVWRAEDQASVVHVGEVVPGGPLMEALRRGCSGATDCIDDYGDFLLRKYAAQYPLHHVPNLGPIYRGGWSLLMQDLTHNTDGVPGYPALDDGWRAGRAVIAPETVTVTIASSSNPGDACFMEGQSGLLYWVGHLVSAPSVGKKFAKGATLSTIFDQGRTKSHVHIGIDARPLIGHQLLYGATGHGPDYTHCPQTVGEQLRKWAMT